MNARIDFNALGAKAAAEGADQTKTTTGGGGDYEPPVAGPCNLRFVSYIEIGKQKGTFQGKPTVKDKVLLTFELSGPKHQPKVMDDGTKLPHRVTIEENLSLNEKARFTKLFARMNYAGAAQHMVQLLGEAYKGEVIHRKYKRRDGKEGIAVELYNKVEGTWTVKPPRAPIFDEEGNDTGEFRVVKVDPAITELKGFLWQYADKAMWDSLFIEGEYPERKNDKGEVTAAAKSKNVLQNTIKLATNFVGSPVYTVLAEAGASLDIPDAEQGMVGGDEDDGDQAAPPAAKPVEVPKGAAADDALNGVV